MRPNVASAAITNDLQCLVVMTERGGGGGVQARAYGDQCSVY